MLRTNKDNNIYFITQPDHAAVSGYFAAHWGNDEFTRPGYYAPSADPEKLRSESVLGIAEHDNGWWEWEASLGDTSKDGLPKGLTAVLRNQEEGMKRWRLGIPRLSDKHPYASLLISYHAYWLYAHSSGVEKNEAFIHPLFWKGTDLYSEDSQPGLEGETLQNALKFVDEVTEMQSGLKKIIRSDASKNGWLSLENLLPHARLIQLLDGLSLSICSDLIPAREGPSKGLGQDEFDLLQVPRKGWGDRLAINIIPKGDRKIGLSPYPFDLDPLGVTVQAKIVEGPIDKPVNLHSEWHSIPKQLIRYEFSSV